MKYCLIVMVLPLWALVLSQACSPASLVLPPPEEEVVKDQGSGDASPDSADQQLTEPAESSCLGGQRQEDSDELCSDGQDNDCDGQTDCDDSSCLESSCVSLCDNKEESNETCADGQDNDDNGFIDCDDYSCILNPRVTVCPHEADCADGVDNDGDGHRDCEDWDCKRMAGSPCPCAANGECDDVACSDGIDNDGNGFVDCRDWDCSRNYNVTVCEGTNDACSDGLDNDGNGFTDCDDFSCQVTSAVSVCCPGSR